MENFSDFGKEQIRKLGRTAMSSVMRTSGAENDGSRERMAGELAEFS